MLDRWYNQHWLDRWYSQHRLDRWYSQHRLDRWYSQQGLIGGIASIGFIGGIASIGLIGIIIIGRCYNQQFSIKLPTLKISQCIVIKKKVNEPTAAVNDGC